MLSPEYPEKAFFITLFLLREDHRILFPINFLFRDLDESPLYIEKLIEEIHKKDDGATVAEHCVLLPLTLLKKYQIKKIKKKKRHKVRYADRHTMIVKAIYDYKLYNMLVLPGYYSSNEKFWYLSAALPIAAHLSEQETDKMITSFNLTVSPDATEYAVYTLNKPLRYDWKSQEITDVEFERDESEVLN